MKKPRILLNQKFRPECICLPCPVYSAVLGINNLAPEDKGFLCGEVLCERMREEKKALTKFYDEEDGLAREYAESPSFVSKNPFYVELISIKKDLEKEEEVPTIVEVKKTEKAKDIPIRDKTENLSNEDSLKKLNIELARVSGGKLKVGPGGQGAIKDSGIKFLNPKKNDFTGLVILYEDLSTNFDGTFSIIKEYFSEWVSTSLGETKKGCACCKHRERFRESMWCMGCSHNRLEKGKVERAEITESSLKDKYEEYTELTM